MLLPQVFPFSKVLELPTKVINFQQQEQEPLGEAWERVNSYNTTGPNLRIPNFMLLQHFICGLRPESAKYLNTATGGAFVFKTPSEGKELVKKDYLEPQRYEN
ncbi:hypothetical protein PR202_gb07907 [Eleusine coracana subsp. coracana]|uniref:Uncharacterized protein n=1 Tax=Eleusine coracana subsp. coracana TaxID=191504 RepID=A0AAV5EAU9_ELECO|nr:hypothetical protein PR202_gb07907 [Eleusine coracana subsp. coracana]